MKRQLMGKGILVGILMALALLALVSCQQPEEFGAVAIDMTDQGSKSLRPEGMDITWVRIGGTCGEESLAVQDFALGGKIAIKGLSVGTWTFSLVGYHGDPKNGGRLLTEVAQKDVTVKSGKTTEATFAMCYLKTGTGSARLTASWPSASATFTKVEMTLQREGAPVMTGETGTFTTAGEDTRATVSFSGMDLGNYDLGLVLTNPSGTTVSFPMFEMASIFSGQETDGTVSLHPEDLVRVSSPSMTVSDASGGKQVTLAVADTGATIRYTTDGSDPATSSTGTAYTKPFSLTGSATVKAVGIRQGFVDSRPSSQGVTVLQAATPTFSPGSTTFKDSQAVTMTSTSGSTIYYTTNGTAPTTSSSSIASGGSMTVSATTTIKAMAVKAGMVNSATAEKTYTKELAYAVGNTGPAGGIIFFVNTDHTYGSWTYLEAALTDEPGTYAWGGYGTLVGGTSTAIGTGKTNTTTIVRALGTAGAAAMVCDSKMLTHDGVIYNDWFLPSRDELDLMYTNLDENGLGSFVSWNYWSSSEYNKYTPHYKTFSGSYGVRVYLIDKSDAFHVRAVRAF